MARVMGFDPGNLPRPELWLPYAFTSPEDAAEAGSGVACEGSMVRRGRFASPLATPILPRAFTAAFQRDSSTARTRGVMGMTRRAAEVLPCVTSNAPFRPVQEPPYLRGCLHLITCRCPANTPRPSVDNRSGMRRCDECRHTVFRISRGAFAKRVVHLRLAEQVGRELVGT